MRNQKKKITALIAALLAAVLLCACGGQTGEETYGPYTREQLYNASYQTWQMLDSMGADELMSTEMYYAQMAAEDETYATSLELLDEWLEVYPELGDFVAVGDFTVDKSGKTTTSTLNIDYSGRDIQVVYVFNTYDMSIDAINIQPVYSMGETMSKAGMNVLMGMGTVFIILILISLIIYAFNIIPYLKEHFAKKGEASAEADIAETADRTPAAASVTEAEDDGELIAVITAAIAASTGAATDSFIVRQIKRRA